MSCSRAERAPSCDDHGASMNRWQVAQAHCPPQSPSMPGTPLSTARPHQRRAGRHVDGVALATEGDESDAWHGRDWNGGGRRPKARR